jgi:hypothetical protein
MGLRILGSSRGPKEIFVLEMMSGSERVQSLPQVSLLETDASSVQGPLLQKILKQVVLLRVFLLE